LKGRYKANENALGELCSQTIIHVDTSSACFYHMFAIQMIGGFGANEKLR